MTNEEKIARAKEKFSKLCLLDNAIMNIAFKNNIPAVQHIVRIILNKPDLVVQKSEIQNFAGSYAGHSVVYDIVAIDKDGTYYNIEMQNDVSKASAERASYHCSMLETKILPSNTDYKELPQRYVIFITKGDPFGFKLPIFHVHRRVDENLEIFNDKETIIYANALCNNPDNALGKLMYDLTQSEPERIKDTQVLYDALYCTKNDEGVANMWVEGFVDNEDELWNKGIKEGIRQNQISNVLGFSKNGASLELISKGTGLSLQEVKDIINSSEK